MYSILGRNKYTDKATKWEARERSKKTTKDKLAGTQSTREWLRDRAKDSGLLQLTGDLGGTPSTEYLQNAWMRAQEKERLAQGYADRVETATSWNRRPHYIKRGAATRAHYYHSEAQNRLKKAEKEERIARITFNKHVLGLPASDRSEARLHLNPSDGRVRDAANELGMEVPAMLGLPTAAGDAAAARAADAAAARAADGHRPGGARPDPGTRAWHEEQGNKMPRGGRRKRRTRRRRKMRTRHRRRKMRTRHRRRKTRTRHRRRKMRTRHRRRKTRTRHRRSRRRRRRRTF